jgi:hypothetical protein
MKRLFIFLFLIAAAITPSTSLCMYGHEELSSDDDDTASEEVKCELAEMAVAEARKAYDTIFSALMAKESERAATLAKLDSEIAQLKAGIPQLLRDWEKAAAKSNRLQTQNK